MTAYYNEWEPYPAQWLRNLIKANLIAPGDVDERSIKDVKADDLKGYTQCHFFAGIGGWSYALRLAGWPDDRPVWTGSCPCQPFSGAGRQEGHSDERHLWPHWRRLIAECRPATVFGEQVAGAVSFGWYDAVSSELETEGYAVAASILPACAVGAPHRRDRLWFVADTECDWVSVRRGNAVVGKAMQIPSGIRGDVGSCGMEQKGSVVADTASIRHTRPRQPIEWCSSETNEAGKAIDAFTGCVGKKWAVEPDVGRVAYGVSDRASKLRAYGNAIVPQVAQAFIEAFMECRP